MATLNPTHSFTH